MKLISFLIGISLIGFHNANKNRTRCYGSYCFTMLDEGLTHSSISSCSPRYQNLEIYDSQMMMDVARFTQEIHAKNNYVELRLECQNVTCCSWMDSKREAGFTKWKTNTSEVLIGSKEVPAFKIDGHFEWTYVKTDVSFSTICMSGIDAYLTTDNSTEFCTWKSFKMELLIFVTASGAFHFMALVTIFILIVSRKIKRQTPDSQHGTSDKTDLEKEEQEINQRKSTAKHDKTENTYQTLHLDDEDDLNYVNLQRIKTL